MTMTTPGAQAHTLAAGIHCSPSDNRTGALHQHVAVPLVHELRGGGHRLVVVLCLVPDLIVSSYSIHHVMAECTMVQCRNIICLRIGKHKHRMHLLCRTGWPLRMLIADCKFQMHHNGLV